MSSTTRRPTGLSPAPRLLVAHALAATAMSMPWPALLAAVWTATGSDTWLGVTGAARLLPYVLLSAAAGLLADRLPRMRVLRWSTSVRALLLVGSGVALSTGQLGVAVGLAVLTVAAGTPAYPAAVAAMPGLAGERKKGSWTDLLVTAEVTAFVVGPAIGGVLLGVGAGSASVLLAAVWSVAAVPLLIGLSTPGVIGGPSTGAGRSRWRTVLGSPGVPVAIAVVAGVNFAESVAGIALLGLSQQRWSAGDRGFGIATAALGFGSLAAPLLGLLARGRTSLLLTGGGLAATAAAPLTSVAMAPLALVGAAGTVVECASTEVLQRSVPDHVRAFSLGLADTAMVLAAMVGALVAPRLVSWVGPEAVFVGLAVTVVVMAALVGAPHRLPTDPALNDDTAASAWQGGERRR